MRAAPYLMFQAITLSSVGAGAPGATSVDRVKTPTSSRSKSKPSAKGSHAASATLEAASARRRAEEQIEAGRGEGERGRIRGIVIVPAAAEEKTEEPVAKARPWRSARAHGPRRTGPSERCTR